MTSTTLVREEIRRFLGGKSPEVICITGKWGVGKTYLWKNEVLSAQDEGKIGFSRYAYASLFGQNSLEAFKTAIIEETVDVGSIGKLPELSSIKSPKKWRSALVGWVSRIASFIPSVRDYVIDAHRLLFSLLVRHQIICIDDLERVGSTLDVKDVLGLISFLKEERGCRVALLLNQEQLEGDNKSDFLIQVEKVIDTRLEFSPSSREASEIAIKGKTIAEVYLSENVQKLGLTNIRVIQKIKRLAIRLEEILASYDPKVIEQAIHSVTLFGWIIYQPKDAPSLDLITDYNPWDHILDKEKKVSPEEENSRAILRAYNFNRVDEFDAVILEGVKVGFFDADRLKEKAKAIVLQLDSNEKNSAFYNAWRTYHDSLTNTAEEVLDRIEAAFRDGVKVVSPGDLSGTVTLFKELGANARAKELIDFYIENHGDDSRDFFDLAKYPFGSEIKDRDVQTAFADKLSHFEVAIDPKDILQRLSVGNGWNQDDVQILSNLTAEDFVKIFKESSGPSLNPMIKRALEFGSYHGAKETKIAETAKEALRSIAAESPINALRIKKFGISK